jgi:hypothetical protein
MSLSFRKMSVVFMPFAIAFVLAIAPPPQAHAQDGSILRGLVEGQMSAFRSGDADAAWSYAAPGIKRMFQTPDRFIAMVRKGYAPVYAPRGVSFGELRTGARGPELDVFVTGPAGRDWLAVYSFEKQADGSWKISGCRLVPGKGASV